MYDPTTQNEAATTQGLREVQGAPRVSLSRIKRGLRRAKVEAGVVCHQSHRDSFINGIFGPRETWMIPGYEAAEWGFIQYLFKTRSVTRIIRLSITTLGSIIVPPLGVLLYSRFLLSTREREKVKYVGSKYAQNNIDAGQDWWFINGTGVNGDLQAANGYHISEIFQKQVRLFYNPTTGLLFDFAQCAVGLLSYKTRPSTQLARALLAAWFNSPTVKIILVVHSMGAIVAANAIKYLIRKGWTKDLHRLELYTFGSPTVEFLYVINKSTMKRAPFYEHYANTHDYFGSLGALRLVNANWWAVGRVFTREQQGHFFGEHYLCGLSEHKYTWRGSTKESRLYSYMPPYPTPVPSINPYTIPEYRINPRRPRRNKSLVSTPPIPPPTLIDTSTPLISSPMPSAPVPVPAASVSISSSTPSIPTLASTNDTPTPIPIPISPTSTPTHILTSTPIPTSSPPESPTPLSPEMPKADTFSLPTNDLSRFLYEYERWQE